MELDRHLAIHQGVNVNRQASLEKWRNTNRPFHWVIEFYGIMADGGFDVVIGNPLYVMYSPKKVPYSLDAGNYVTFPSKNPLLDDARTVNPTRQAPSTRKSRRPIDRSLLGKGGRVAESPHE